MNLGMQRPFLRVCQPNAKGYMPPHTLLRPRSGEWACEQTNDNLPCCIPMTDDPDPPGQSDLLKTPGAANAYRGCCIRHQKHINITFPHYSSENANYLSYSGQDITHKAMCTRDHITPFLSVNKSLVEDVYWHDKITFGRRAFFIPYPNSMQILDMCNSDFYYKEISELVIPPDGANETAIYIDTGTTTSAPMASNISATKALGGFLVGSTELMKTPEFLLKCIVSLMLHLKSQ